MYLKIISIAIVTLLLYGLTQRRRPHVHIPVMLFCFVADMLVVLYIELSRQAVGQLLTPNNPFIMKVHLFFSIGVLLFYLIQIVTGFIRYKRGGMKIHLYTGICFLICRFGNLITSFMIETH